MTRNEWLQAAKHCEKMAKEVKGKEDKEFWEKEAYIAYIHAVAPTYCPN